MSRSRAVTNYVLGFLASHVVNYPTSPNLTYAWSFGFSAGMCLIIQIVTGVFLAMHYSPHIDLAFDSVEHIMRNVNNGWFLRYAHANGASIFFIVVYAHILRGLYYGSYMYPRELLWISGVVIFLLMMATAFMGYVLPWGQMSFWGTTVITNFVTALPKIGKPIVEWLWGGYSIGNATLNRFFVLHFVMPFVIAGVTLLHLALLHQNGSNNPLGTDNLTDNVPFYPYYVVKDLFVFVLLMQLFVVLVFFYPNTLGHPDNYIPADPMRTPAHIVPEWYFLPYYSILRTIPHKAGGILTMLGAILILLPIPYTNTSEVRSTQFRPIFKHCFWLLVVCFAILMWTGQKPMEYPYTDAAKYATLYYYAFFVVLIPLVGNLEGFLARIPLTQDPRTGRYLALEQEVRDAFKG